MVSRSFHEDSHRIIPLCLNIHRPVLDCHQLLNLHQQLRSELPQAYDHSLLHPWDIRRYVCSHALYYSSVPCVVSLEATIPYLSVRGRVGVKRDCLNIEMWSARLLSTKQDSHLFWSQPRKRCGSKKQCATSKYHKAQVRAEKESLVLTAKGIGFVI